MEAAAKTVELLTQRILPEKPHHLSFSPDWRYRIPPDDASSRHFEEWDNPRLQYLTLVSEADRGVLLTRPYYDMRVEPPKPAPREVNALAKPAGEKKKLSLSDYKNKKTGVVSVDSTPEPTSAKKRETDRAPVLDSRPAPESKKPDGHKPRDPQPPMPPKSREPVVDMRLPPKPPTKASLPPRPPSPDSRKRGPDADGDARPQKRPRPDIGRPLDDRSRPPRDEPPRRKDRELLPSQDRTPQRETKPAPPPPPSSLPNGRTSLKAAMGANRNTSPAGRPRGDSVNGARPNVGGSAKATPAKPDAPAKSSLPPLLSPLRLSLDGREGDTLERGEKKKPREEPLDRDRDSTKPAKPRKSEVSSASKPDTHPGSKRDKSPLPLPALLSPTLPPLIEAELLRQKKSSPKALDSKSKPEKVFSATARKAPVEGDGGEDDEGAGGREKEKRTRLMAKIRIPKRMRQNVKRILALPPRKESQRQERSASSEAQSQAKKRPVTGGSFDNVGDSIAVKRPRPSDISSSSRLPPPPQTPSKKGTTAMSRVSSNNSQAHTPGDVATATPSAPGSSERLANGTDGSKAEARTMMDKSNRLSGLGKRLKHSGDVAMNRPPAVNGNSGRGGESTGIKLGYVLTLESILAFMMSFQALNTSRSLSGKASVTSSWESLFPLADYLQGQMRRLDQRHYQPLIALLHLMYAAAVEELQKCYATYENPSAHVSVNELCRLTKMRTRALSLLREANDAIESRSLRVDVAPGLMVDEVAESALRVLKRWCADEDVHWNPEISLGDTVRNHAG